MNSYLALRKANKLRFAMVTETSQKQIQDIVHYLQVTSWDISGVEAIKSDLIDMAIQANKDGKELFTVPEEASSFAVEMKKQCATPNIQNLFFILIWYFLYNAIGYLLLFFVDQEQTGKQDKESAGPDCATICRPQDFFLNMSRTKRKRKLVEWLESCQENQVNVLDEKIPLLSFAVDFVTAYEYQKARGIKIHPGLWKDMRVDIFLVKKEN